MWWLVGMKKALENRGISAPLVFFQMLFTVRLVFLVEDESVYNHIFPKSVTCDKFRKQR